MGHGCGSPSTRGSTCLDLFQQDNSSAQLGMPWLQLDATSSALGPTACAGAGQQSLPTAPLRTPLYPVFSATLQWRPPPRTFSSPFTRPIRRRRCKPPRAGAGAYPPRYGGGWLGRQAPPRAQLAQSNHPSREIIFGALRCPALCSGCTIACICWAACCGPTVPPAISPHPRAPSGSRLNTSHLAALRLRLGCLIIAIVPLLQRTRRPGASFRPG